ncbi:hypothetical protein [Spirochaeta dissipatitropha]
MFLTSPIAAQVVFQSRPGGSVIPDSSETRLLYAGELDAPLRQILSRQSREHFQRTNLEYLRYEVIAEHDAVYQLFLFRRGGNHPIDSAGNYIIKRNRETGLYEQVKIFLLSDPDFFVRIFPVSNSLSRMDVIIAGDTVYRGVRIPLSFQRILIEPFDMIVSLTSNIVPWKKLVPGKTDDLDAFSRESASGFRDSAVLPAAYRRPAATETIPMDTLRSRIYYEYVAEPGVMFFGKVYSSEHSNRQVLTDDLYIFPYREESGRYRTAVFSAGRQISLHALAARFPEAYFEGDVYRPDFLSR